MAFTFSWREGVRGKNLKWRHIEMTLKNLKWGHIAMTLCKGDSAGPITVGTKHREKSF